MPLTALILHQQNTVGAVPAQPSVVTLQGEDVTPTLVGESELQSTMQGSARTDVIIGETARK